LQFINITKYFYIILIRKLWQKEKRKGESANNFTAKTLKKFSIFSA